MAEALPEYPDSDFSDEEQTPLDISFNKATAHVRKITSKLNNNQLLELYGLFKQGTEGQCNTPKPGWLDGRGRRKWEAWRALGSLSQDEAKQKYIYLIQKYDPEFENPFNETEHDGIKEAWVAVSSLRYSPEPELNHHELSLLEAARENLSERIRKLLTEDPELKHEKDDDGLTALHWAADRDATDALRALIEAGCILDTTDHFGQTALHYTAACGHVESTKILIEAGASLMTDEEDCTPLDVAADDEIRNILQGAKNE